MAEQARLILQSKDFDRSTDASECVGQISYQTEFKFS